MLSLAGAKTRSFRPVFPACEEKRHSATLVNRVQALQSIALAGHDDPGYLVKMPIRSVTCTPRRPGKLLPAVAVVLLALAACNGESDAGNAVPGDRDDRKPWEGVSVADRIRVSGTEPFWNAEIRNGLFTYRTPERPAGDQATFSRFAGRGGVSFSGELVGRDFTLAIGPGPCNDGMSDRIYPFNATLKIGDDMRKGCAWSDRRPARPTHRADSTRSAAESGIATSEAAIAPEASSTP